MLVIKRIDQIRKIIGLERRKGKTIGFVPTMGALHEGHLSLVRKAHQVSDLLVVSIFVNPIQFGPKEDYKRYPRNIERDCALLKKAAVDIVFIPEVREMYPPSHRTSVEVADWSDILCGASRPGHFRGVTTVVLKLFNIVKPDIAVFGRKDLQQAVIIRKMVSDLNMGVTVMTAPTLREKDGLAMSSRNVYLNAEQRSRAGVLYRSLQGAKKEFGQGKTSAGLIIDNMKRMIRARGGRIDYIKAVRAKDLMPVKKLRRGDAIVLAVFFGGTRLIDNIVL